MPENYKDTEDDENIKGRRDNNPILDTREYLVQYPNGSEDMLTYAKVLDNLCSQVDVEYNQINIYSGIFGHCKGIRAVKKADEFYESNSLQYRKNITAKWELDIEWKYGSISWIPILVLNNDNPLYVERYAVNNKIEDEPIFDWWYHEVLKRYTKSINSGKHYFRTGYKYGINIPNIFNHALHINEDSGSYLWINATNKEKEIMKVYLKLMKEEDNQLQDFRKMDFTQK